MFRILHRFAKKELRFLFLLSMLFLFSTQTVLAKRYVMEEIIGAGEHFFGTTSKSLAKSIEKIFSSYGEPDGYVLGEEFAGSWILGITYGEGVLQTKEMGTKKIFWQGPSFGIDFGGQGSQVMILAYNIDNIDAVYGRFGGFAGSAYVIAGIGFNVLKNGQKILIPIRTGLGVKLGLNVGYLNFTPKPTWNPF